MKKYLVEYAIKPLTVALVHIAIGIIGYGCMVLCCPNEMKILMLLSSSTVTVLLLLLAITSYVGWLIGVLFDPKKYI